MSIFLLAIQQGLFNYVLPSTFKIYEIDKRCIPPLPLGKRAKPRQVARSSA